MRKFDIRYNGQTIAWSLDLRDSIYQLNKLADEKYELRDKTTGELAYTVMPGWRNFQFESVIDEKQNHTLNFGVWAEYEYREYGM